MSNFASYSYFPSSCAAIMLERFPRIKGPFKDMDEHKAVEFFEKRLPEIHATMGTNREQMSMCILNNHQVTPAIHNVFIKNDWKLVAADLFNYARTNYMYIKVVPTDKQPEVGPFGVVESLPFIERTDNDLTGLYDEEDEGDNYEFEEEEDDIYADGTYGS